MSLDIEKIQFYKGAAARICSSLDLEKALWRFYEYVKDFIPMTGASLVVTDSDYNMKHLAYISTNKNPLHRSSTRPFSLTDEIKRELERLRQTSETVLIFNRAHLEPVIEAIMQKVGVISRPFSLMIMQLGIEGNAIGAMSIYDEGADRFNEEHAALLSTLHDPIAIATLNAAKHHEVLKLKDMLEDDKVFLNEELLRLSGDKIIGEDNGLKSVMDLVRQVSPLDSPVLLLGETGVGKEVVANAVHYSSSRKNGPFVKVNCGAIPESLMDSELFGHEKGAFTGATVQKRGRFERAHNGTIFLDEIGDLPFEAQSRLLRVLQNKQIERVGGTNYIDLDIRVIAATNRDLNQMAALGRFRQDLLFRLNVFPIEIPSLKDRKEDIPALVHYFVEQKARDFKFHVVPEVDPKSIEALMEYHWPGNVRELENFVERNLIKIRGQKKSGPLVFEPLLFKPTDPDTSISSDQVSSLPSLDQVVFDHIKRALKLSNGKIFGPDGAAASLSMNPDTLRSKMRKFGIRVKKSV